MDFASRPAKHVERSMIAEALLRLRRVAPLADYTYVGFGASQFIDFSLFHRALGISAMTSIERAEDDTLRHRHDFNRPFGSVGVRFGQSSDILPQLSWDGLTIAWLDYDSQLRRNELRDIEYLGHRMVPASVLIVTLNAHAEYGRRLKALLANVGKEVITPGLNESDLASPWSFAREQYRIVDQALGDSIAARTDGAKRRQFLNFRYKDGARMQTIGWLIDAPGVTQTLDACKWAELGFTRPGSETFEITVPRLSARELAHLEQLMPASGGDDCPEWLSRDDYLRFASLYRWYPEPSS